MSGPSPTGIFEALSAFHKTEALKAGIELDVFSAIEEGQKTPSALATRCQTSERGMRILCDTLAAHGFLRKNCTTYSNTEDTAVFLVKKSPAYVGGCIHFLNSPEMAQAYRRGADAVRRGGTVINSDGGFISAENPAWVDFARGMYNMARPIARAMADLLEVETKPSCKVLDVAGGHGVYGITLAERNPRAEVHLLDWKDVTEVAQQFAEQAGVQDRYHTSPGNAFEVYWGRDYDVILLTNFLHHFDSETCIDVLRRAHAALKEDGVVVTVEFVPNEDRVSPPVSAAFSFTMLCCTESGDAYTFSELNRMFKKAGFARSVLHPLPGLPSSVVLSRK